MVGLIFFIYGLIFGSFFNVVIYRVPLEEKIYDGHSKCTTCGEKIKFRYLIPIFSWLYLRGRSACCNQKISAMYPVIELLSGIGFYLSYVMFGAGMLSIYYIILLSFILIVGTIDFKHKVIYDYMLFYYLICGILMQVFFIGNTIDCLVGASIAYASYYLIYYITKKVYGEEKFGLGDVLYITVIGFYLGSRYIFFIIFGPFYLALFYYIVAKFIFGAKLDTKSEIPFGPFISATVAILVIGINLFLQ